MTHATEDARARLYGAPRLPSRLLSRPRLLDPLEHAGALTVVRGPAGSGKTVLLADWVRVRSAAVPGVWVTMDETASSRGGFWRVVLQTVIDAGVATDDIRLHDAISALENPHQLRRELLRSFAHLDRGLTLVLDSFEAVTDPLVPEDLAWILRNCAGLQVVVATRMLGHLENSVDAVHLDPALITPDQLLFTVAETAGVLELAELGDDADLADAVHRATGGIPLATRAAVIALRNDPTGFSPLLAQRQLTETLAPFLRQVMAEGEMRPQLFDFAARTAVAEILTVDLARELSGLDNADALLDEVEANGIGMWSTGVHGRIFSYTPLVRTALVAELRERYPDERAHLWRIAAQWSARHGQWMTAISLAVDINDFALANRIAREPWFELGARYNARIIEIFGPVPRRKLRKYPLLLMLLALAYNAYGKHRIRSLETFGLAIAAIRLSTPSDLAERVLLMTAECAALRVSGNIERAVPVAEKAMRLLDDLGPEDRDQLGVNFGMVLNQVGLTFFYSGRSDEALRAFSAAYSQAGDSQDRSRFHSIALLCGVHAVHGDMAEARRLVDEAATLHWPDGWRNGYIGSMRHLAEAFLQLEQFDFESARAHVTAMAPHLETLEHWPLFAHVSAMIELGQGRALGGETALAAEMTRGSRPSITRFTRARLDASRALLLLASGHPGRAGKLLRGHPAELPPVAVMRARYELMAGHPEQVIQILNQTVTGRDGSARSRAEGLLITAAAALRLGNSSVALSSLDQMAALMRDRGVRFQLMLVPRSDLEALRGEALAQPGSLAGELLADLSAVPVALPESLPRMELSQRESIVLRELVRTGNTTELATALFVSTNTVKSQVRSIYRKLGVNSRDEALLVAADQGLLSD